MGRGMIPGPICERPCYNLFITYLTMTEINTVYFHFHSVKILLFSSAISRDFDGMLDTGLPVSMYTTKTPIDMCRFKVLSST
jgi:hypothetical protein